MAVDQDIPVEKKRSVLTPDYSTDVAQENRPNSLVGTLVVWIYRLIVICFGLLLIMGGGVLGLCGANGRGNDWILIVIGFLPLALGGFLIATVFKTDRKTDEAPSTAELGQTERR